MIENNYWSRIGDALNRQGIDPGDSHKLVEIA